MLAQSWTQASVHVTACLICTQEQPIAQPPSARSRGRTAGAHEVPEDAGEVGRHWAAQEPERFSVHGGDCAEGGSMRERDSEGRASRHSFGMSSLFAMTSQRNEKS